MFVWTACTTCGCQCGAASGNAPKTALTAWGSSHVVIDMNRPMDGAVTYCTSWTTFNGNAQFCVNCTRPFEEHHGAKNFCFPFYMFSKCCACSEADGHVGTLFVESWGCYECKKKMREKIELRRREEEAAEARTRAEAEVAMAKADLERKAVEERRRREVEFAEARAQILEERREREAAHFAPLDWLRTFVEDVAPQPPRQNQEREGGEYLRLQGRGMTEHWWGWRADDPPAHLM